MSIISCTSPSASERILPTSSVTRSARSSLCSAQQLAEPLDQRAAHRRRHRPPGQERLVRDRDRSVHVVGARPRDAAAGPAPVTGVREPASPRSEPRSTPHRAERLAGQVAQVVRVGQRARAHVSSSGSSVSASRSASVPSRPYGSSTRLTAARVARSRAARARPTTRRWRAQAVLGGERARRAARPARTPPPATPSRRRGRSPSGSTTLRCRPPSPTWPKSASTAPGTCSAYDVSSLGARRHQGRPRQRDVHAPAPCRPGPAPR